MDYLLVTGGSGGMGRAAVELLLEKGYGVIVLDKAPCCEGAIWVQTDISDINSIRCAFDTVKGITDKLCGIIHYAGIYMLYSLVEMCEKSFEDIFRINLFGAFAVNKTFLPLIKEGGRIIITTSELAPLDPLPFTGIYAVTKGALDKYAYSLAMELQLLDIKVSVLRAGAVSTNMLGVSTSSLDSFCRDTRLYKCNARRFKAIVDKVEARSISPQKIAQRTFRILKSKHPRFAYSINRNPLLLLLNVLPKRMQLLIIKAVLKTKD